MRIELIYTPDCLSYKQAMNKLEMVIAEEHLPIPVEAVETSSLSSAASQTILIDGEQVTDMLSAPQGKFCHLYQTRKGLAAVPSTDQLRDIIGKHWKEYTDAPLSSELQRVA